ncbi:carbon-nitrogen hydrolase family protein [Fredinandcohnia onubensis]|uniref:carbon-nitrogen hydrolase family protein n=1 Tax=Fredinandcohnia onubensis TaxID=1571209 RepID=UPI000C0BD8C9|nr:carbon-nitrogen hydrolase family protein [Fredinandcohnia onubensis]
MEIKQNCKVAVVQASGILFDTEATVRKTIYLIEEAGNDQVDLILFPEAFIGGYPRGLNFDTYVGIRTDSGRDDFFRYANSAIEIPGKETEQISEAIKKVGAYVVIGVIEKEKNFRGASLYCTAIIFGPDGKILAKHRKLKPTGSERLIWAEGDGSTLPVIETPFGRIGVLICWENYMPLARAAMYGKGVDLYLAPTADARDGWFASMQHIALEGRCFVLSCNQYMTKNDYPEDVRNRPFFSDLEDELCRGGSCIVSPFGSFIEQPFLGAEKILISELDLSQLTKSRYDFDVVGHYARNDVFSLTVNEKKQQSVVYIQDEINKEESAK